MMPTIRFGSMNYTTLMAEKYDDILYVIKSTEKPLIDIDIICKPNYNIEEVLNFTKEHLPLSVTYRIIVEDYTNVIQ